MTELVVVREVLEDRELANFLPLVPAGFRVRFVTSGESGPYDGSGLGVPVTRLRRVKDFLGPARVGRRIARLMSPRLDLETLLGLKKALGPANIVCVNETHNVSSVQACRIANRQPGMRVVTVCYENIPFRYEDDPLLRARKAFVRTHTDLFVALTPAAENALCLEGASPQRIAVQPYGVDAARFSPNERDASLRASWKVAPDEVVVLYAGRLIQEKGLTNLLIAASQIQHLPFRVILVGAGGDLPRLQRAVVALHLEDRVTFVPWVPHAQVPSVLASADIFAMPSLPTPYWEEQFGFSMVEAMASGLPVVSTESGSIPFVVGDGAALVPPYNIEALSTALARLVADPDLRVRMGGDGRRRIETELNVETVARRLARLLAPTHA